MDGKRIGFFGASGCGKTYALRQFIKQYDSFIFIDPKHEFDAARQYSHATSFRQCLFSIKRQSETGKVKLVFYPADHFEAEKLLNFIFDYAVKPILTVVDECQEICPSGTATKNPYNPLLKISRLGRSRGLSLAIASQRIKTVDISLRSNLNSMLLFRQGDFSDAQEIKRMTGLDLFGLKPKNFVLRTENGDIMEFKDVKRLKHWF